jgi:hypothetical protein
MKTNNAGLSFRAAFEAFNFEHFFINIIAGFLVTAHVATFST